MIIGKKRKNDAMVYSNNETQNTQKHFKQVVPPVPI